MERHTRYDVRVAPPVEAGVPGNERAWALEALSSIVDGVLVVDAAARLVFKNEAAARIAGVESLPPDPSRWSEGFGVFRSDETTPLPPTEIPLAAALRGEVVRDLALFVRNPRVPEGVHLLCNANPLRDPRGVLVGAVVIFHDITEARLREGRIVEAERQTKAILDNIGDMAWLKDREGRYLLANRSLAEAAGRGSPDNVVGLTDLDLWPREHAERYRADDEEVMRTRVHKRVDEPMSDARGQRWLETFKTCIVGERGEILGTTGIARDVTKRKNAEEALRSLNDELEKRVQARTEELATAQEELVRKERLATLGQLAGGVAHQIRNPLAAIMNASYVLKRHLAPDQHPHVDDAIRIIHDEVRHANVIITGLLDFAKVRAPDRHPTSIVDLVERVLAAETLPPGVRVERALGEVPPLAVDANQIESALYNVVRNALEAMPGSGVLRVEVVLEDASVMVAVTDSGPGISPKVRGHLFEPLHSTKPAGVGLGLITSRTLVEAHGGEIRNVDVPVGARFEIRLPLR
jgi:PAS domain S-box-containing protein